MKKLPMMIPVILLFCLVSFSGCFGEDSITIKVWYNYHPYSEPGDPLSYNVTLGMFDEVYDSVYHESTGITPDIVLMIHLEYEEKDPIYVQVWNEDFDLWAEKTIDVEKTPFIVINIGPSLVEIDTYTEEPGFK
jgi:hypothetical protein